MVSSRSRPLAVGLLLLWACHPPASPSEPPPPAAADPSAEVPPDFSSLEVEQTGPLVTAPLDLPFCGELLTNTSFHTVSAASPRLLWGLTYSGIQSVEGTTSTTRTVTYDLPLEGRTYSGLRAISSPSETVAWAVGEQGRILRWDGSSWSAEESHTTEVLTTVWADASGEAWAGGEGEHGTLLHRSGGSWSAVPGVAPWGIWALWGRQASDLWASGAGKMLHWDGKAWRTTLTGAGYFTLADGTFPDNVWLTWTRNEILDPPTWRLLHWNGTRWTQVEWSTIMAGGGASVISSLWVRGPNDVWVGGFEQYRNFDSGGETHEPPERYVYHARHWDGQRWNEVPFSSFFRAVWNGETWMVFVGDRFLRLCP